MKLKRLGSLLISLIILNGCVESTALLGPAISVGANGNVYQAGLSYSTNTIVKKSTGKTPVEHIKNYVVNHECEMEFSCFVEKNIAKTKEILSKHKGRLN
tara:strand:- start:11909 stop:12208 length:300 start_codon:yes stop_codon:yes gene_type:complete